jgi:hypothetical protein
MVADFDYAVRSLKLHRELCILLNKFCFSLNRRGLKWIEAKISNRNEILESVYVLYVVASSIFDNGFNTGIVITMLLIRQCGFKTQSVTFLKL